MLTTEDKRFMEMHSLTAEDMEAYKIEMEADLMREQLKIAKHFAKSMEKERQHAKKHQDNIDQLMHDEVDRANLEYWQALVDHYVN